MPSQLSLAEHLRCLVKEVAMGRESARLVARTAVAQGCVLIGSTEPQEEYVPVAADEHRHFWHLHNGWHNLLSGGKATYATALADVAIAEALFGSHNSRKQRIARCQPLAGEHEQYFGWATDPAETAALFREPPLAVLRNDERIVLPERLLPGDYPLWLAWLPLKEDAQGSDDVEKEVGVSIYARSELLDAACDPDNPLRGYIGFVPHDLKIWERYPIQEPGAWMTDQVTKPIAIMPVTGHDLRRTVKVCNFGPGDHERIVQRDMSPTT